MGNDLDYTKLNSSAREASQKIASPLRNHQEFQHFC